MKTNGNGIRNLNSGNLFLKKEREQNEIRYFNHFER